MPKDKEINVGGIVKKPGSTTKNKTGEWRTFKPVRDEKKCTKCMLCWQFCPDACISKEIKTDYDFCKGCGICAEICPVKAIKMVKEEK